MVVAVEHDVDAAGDELGRTDINDSATPTLFTRADSPLSTGVYYIGVSSLSNT